MNKEKLLAKLNWFYSLELNQVDLYQTQSKHAKDPHLARALAKFAEIEQGHVENIRETIERLESTPTLIGEVVGQITGKIAGGLSNWSSWDKMLRFNVKLEKKAIADYKDMMEYVDDPQIKALLLNNMIDEELHTSWMLRRIALLKRPVRVH